MKRSLARWRRTTVLVAAMAAGLSGLAMAAPAQAAVRPGQLSAGPANTGHSSASGTAKSRVPVRALCAAPAKPHQNTCMSVQRTDIAGAKGIRPHTAAPSGFGPADLQSAYALPSGTAGIGQTVAIVDAFDDPTAEADLAVYRGQYGLSACTTANGCFRKVNQFGKADGLPTADKGWAGEISLDVDMVSAVCPGCDILLVEAASNDDSDLYQAVNTAVAMGAKYVSNSWGGLENATETANDESTFNHPGVAITVSSGDDGYGAAYPAASKYVTAVGGTSLSRDPGAARGWTESAWTGAGSGCSAYEAKPAFQTDPDCPRRTVADVSAVADPATGLAVYDSYQEPGWGVFGGTSASAPIVAGVYALAGPAPAGTFPNSFPYAAKGGLNDVTSGVNGACGGSYLCTATAGYDGPTGLGTPSGVRAFRPAVPYGTLSGTVTGDGKPLAGATVAAGTLSATTDASGHYSLGLPAGTYDLTATAYGYAPKTVTAVTVTEDQTTTTDFALNGLARATISGTVRDGSGHGWPLYASIKIDGVPGGPVFTDPVTGRYSVDLPVGTTYKLHVTSRYPGYTAVDQSVDLGNVSVTRDVDVPVDTTGCAAPGYARQHTGVSESFDTADTPAGWTVVNHTTTGGWAFTDPGNRGNKTGGSGGFAIVDSDLAGYANSQDTELRSPVVDMSAMSTPAISFDTDYHVFQGSIADVDLSLDSGSTWQNVAHYSQDVPGPHHVRIPVPQAAGKPGVQVRFHYTGTWAFWWEVDNALIGNESCDPEPGGLVVGRVTDHNTGAGVNGATVVDTDHPADTSRTGATPDDPALGDGFYWMFSSLTGGHPFAASANRYQSAKATVNVAANAVTRADFAVTAGRISVKPGSIRKTVAFGAQATAKVTLHNDGTEPATVTVGEQDGGFTMLTRLGSGAPPQRVAGTYSPHRLALNGKPGPAKKPLVKPAATPYAPPWTDIANYPTPIEDNAVGFDHGKLYSVGGTDGSAIVGTGAVFDPATGAWTPIAPLKTAREKPSGAFIGGKFYVVGGWGADGNPVAAMEVYDPSSNSWSTAASLPTPYAAASAAVVAGRLYLVGGCDSLACGESKVSVYDPATNTWGTAADYPRQVSWASCGGIGGQLYCAGGTGDSSGETKQGYAYDPASNTWSPLPDMPIDLWGSSFAAANGVLLVSGGVTNGQSALTNQGYAYDPVSRAWTALPNSNNAFYRSGGACGFYKVGGDLGGFTSQNKAEVLPGFEQCGAGPDVPWLSEDPATVTIAPGKSATVTVTLDASVTAVNQPGAYAAKLNLATDTPYPVAPVDVTMNVSPPKTWGKITGTVTGVACGGASTPLAGATVQIDTWATHYTLRTDAGGRYALWLDVRNNPLDVIVAKDGYQPKYKQVKIAALKTTTVDWPLATAQTC